MCCVSQPADEPHRHQCESVILPLGSIVYVADIDLFNGKQLLAQGSPVLLSDVPLAVPVGLPG